MSESRQNHRAQISSFVLFFFSVSNPNVTGLKVNNCSSTRKTERLLITTRENCYETRKRLPVGRLALASCVDSTSKPATEVRLLAADSDAVWLQVVDLKVRSSYRRTVGRLMYTWLSQPPTWPFSAAAATDDARPAKQALIDGARISTDEATSGTGASSDDCQWSAKLTRSYTVAPISQTSLQVWLTDWLTDCCAAPRRFDRQDDNADTDDRSVLPVCSGSL